MFVVLCVNLIDRGRSRRNTAGVDLPPVRYTYMVTITDHPIIHKRQSMTDIRQGHPRRTTVPDNYSGQLLRTTTPDNYS